MKRIGRNVTLVLILIFVLISSEASSSYITWIPEEMGKKLGKEYYMELAKSKPWKAFKYVDYYKDRSYGAAIIKKAVETAIESDPWTALLNMDCYMDQLYKQKAIETAVVNDPRGGLIALVQFRQKFKQEIKRILQKSKKPFAETILAINSDIDDFFLRKKVGVLLDEIVSGNITLEQAANIASDEERFFEALVRIKSRPNHLGKVAVDQELKDLALYAVWRVNMRHDELDEIRFASVKNASSRELYTFMVYGEEEIFTSSFNGLFERLLSAMEKEEINGNELLENLGHNKFRTFIKLCTGFNRLNEFLETMDENSRRVLLEKFVKDIDKEKDSLEQAVVVADTFSMLEDGEALRVLQETIKEEYERVKLEESKEGMVLYGLLAGMFGENAVINEAWIREMAEKYQLPDLTGILSEELFDSNGLNVQHYFFYNDKDGRASFRNFLSQYRGEQSWKIEDKGSFIVIKSTRNDRKIEIYANKPEAAETGPEEIAKILKERNIQPVVVVHRGHSYHAQKSIERISSSARIVSLGSCGGYNNISAVVGRASEAHIISTKATGTMLVNDPLLKMLNEEILTGKDIYWSEFWQKAEKKLGRISDFQNYIPPHKNLGVLFLKTYHCLIKN